MTAVSKFKNEAVSDESAINTRGCSSLCTYPVQRLCIQLVVWFPPLIKSNACSTRQSCLRGDVIGPKPDYCMLRSGFAKWRLQRGVPRERRPVYSRSRDGRATEDLRAILRLRPKNHVFLWSRVKISDARPSGLSVHCWRFQG